MVCGLGQLHIQCLTSTGPEFWTLLLNCVALLIVLSSTPVAFHQFAPLIGQQTNSLYSINTLSTRQMMRRFSKISIRGYCFI